MWDDSKLPGVDLYDEKGWFFDLNRTNDVEWEIGNPLMQFLNKMVKTVKPKHRFDFYNFAL